MSLLVFPSFAKQIKALGKSARNQWAVAPYLLDNLHTMNLQPTTVTVNAAMTGFMAAASRERLTLPETNSSPLKIGRSPKGKDGLSTINFQVLC